MSDIDDIEWAHVAYFETTSGRDWDPYLQVEESHDLGIRAVIAATREQVAKEIFALADACHGAGGKARSCGSLWRRGVQDAAGIARGES